MTSARPTDVVPDLTGLHDLLWAVRHDPAVARRVTADLDGISRAYDLTPATAAMVERRDVAALFGLGVNPYLLFFAALELGVTRPEYYARLDAARGSDA